MAMIIPQKKCRDDTEDLRGSPELLFGGSTYPGRGRSRIPVSRARGKVCCPEKRFKHATT